MGRGRKRRTENGERRTENGERSTRARAGGKIDGVVFDIISVAHGDVGGLGVGGGGGVDPGGCGVGPGDDDAVGGGVDDMEVVDGGAGTHVEEGMPGTLSKSSINGSVSNGAQRVRNWTGEEG